MNDDRPLNALASSLLDTERLRAENEGEAADRIFARLASTLASPPDGDGDGDGDGGDGDGSAGSGVGSPRTGGGSGSAGSGDGSGSAAGGAGGSIAAPVARATATRTLTTTLLSKTAALVVGAFAIGTGVGAFGHAKLSAHDGDAPTTATAAVATTHLPAPPIGASAMTNANANANANGATSVFGTATTAAPDRSAEPTPASRATSSARPPASLDRDKDVTLARERAWIDRARAAMARGSASDALVALDGHAHEFPSGRMMEERDALRVHALASAGRNTEAETLARAFRVRYRSSVFLPIVDRAAPLPKP